MVYCYIQHRELCVLLYWFTVIYSTENCVYSCTAVQLYAAQEIVCTAVLLYCYIQQSLLCVQLYSCTVIYSTVNCVYSCTGVRLYTTHVIVCTAVLVHCYIQHRKLCLQLYRCTVMYSTGNREYFVHLYGVFLYRAQAIGNIVYSCTCVLLYTAQ
jgi:hypothetical protein